MYDERGHRQRQIRVAAGALLFVGEPTWVGGEANDNQSSQRGIATQLVKAICQKLRSEGIRTVRTDVDRRDIQLLDFVEQRGFSVGNLIDY